MEEWLHLVTKDAVVVIDAMALIVVVIGTAEAFFTGLRAAFPATAAHRRFREVLVRTGTGSSLASRSSSQPTSSRRRLHQPGRR